VREPLLHFLLLGGLLFAGARWREPSDSASSPIVVDRHLKDNLARGFQAKNGRPPNGDELAAEVRRHVDEQVLHREGVARGLHEDDPVVRQRVAEKMGKLLQLPLVTRDPTAAELDDWFAKNRERFFRPVLVDFVHVFLEGSDGGQSQRANDLLDRLRAGADPAGLGDRFSGGRHYRGRRLTDLAETFGDEFVRGLEDAPLGTWSLRRSRFGLHLLRVEARTPPERPGLDAVRAEARRQWQDGERARLFAERLAELRRRHRVEERE
jgi:hypothetical protein